MFKELEKLPGSEVELLAKAPLLVCILIAGADDEIDNKEIKGAIELAKKSKTKASIAEFYRLVSEDFEDKLKIILQSLPQDSANRNLLISKELSQLNSILVKVDKIFSKDFYDSLRYIAKKIAESSGGLLGLKSVGEEEMKFIALPMIKDPSL
ncbi:MAG: hypothetical protein HOP08_14480 [Cyclobacteriaceae bacterium]|nr:hypothetical protein [Cyclobacteriaceae bacterium]